MRRVIDACATPLLRLFEESTLASSSAIVLAIKARLQEMNQFNRIYPYVDIRLEGPFYLGSNS